MLVLDAVEAGASMYEDARDLAGVVLPSPFRREHLEGQTCCL